MAHTSAFGSFMINIISIVVALASIIGLIFLTNFTFSAKTKDDKTYTVSNFSGTKLTFSKITIVLLWIQICIVFLAVMWSLARLHSS